MTALALVLRRWWPALLVLALAGVLLWQRGTIADARRDLAAEQAAHRQTVADYRTAAEKARGDDAANIVRVAAEQARITEETSRDYQNRLADARARADALRLQLAQTAADPGAGRAAPVPAAGATAGRPDGAAAPARLPELTLAERLTATEQAIQLDALQSWVRAQADIDPGNDQR